MPNISSASRRISGLRLKPLPEPTSAAGRAPVSAVISRQKPLSSESMPATSPAVSAPGRKFSTPMPSMRPRSPGFERVPEKVVRTRQAASMP